LVFSDGGGHQTWPEAIAAVVESGSAKVPDGRCKTTIFLPDCASIGMVVPMVPDEPINHDAFFG
jgi:hypothetical protein